MSNKVNFSFRIPIEAISRNKSQFVEHTDFLKYCKANKVDITENELESYEKSGLLYPCYRILYPRELLVRHFRNDYKSNNPPYKDKGYKIRKEWEPVIDIGNRIRNSTFPLHKDFTAAIKFGHPLEQSIEDGNPFVFLPEKQTFKAWDKYKVIVGKMDGHKMRESKAVHYYSPWKILLVNDLNMLNTIKHNHATGNRRTHGWFDKHLRYSSMNEFIPFFNNVASFFYRYDLLRTNYFHNMKQTKKNWKSIVYKNEQNAKQYFSAFDYIKWIRFLRKLLEIHEKHLKEEQIILSFEAKSYISETVIFLRYATNNKFDKICNDVSGIFIKSFGVGYEEGVEVYPRKLEELFADEKWDLEKNVKWILNHGLKRLNSTLAKKDKLPETLADELFNELLNEPSGTAIASIRKINRSYYENELWRDSETWSGIRDFAISLEDHGRNWFKGKYFYNILSAFHESYQDLRNKSAIKNPTDADNKDEFIRKIKHFHKKREIPNNRRCGSHLLIAHITRNFSSHGKGIFGKELRHNLPLIYNSLLNTLFVFYAQYKIISAK